jgi:tRNA pseudouridine38-40 synthase
VRTIRLLLAYDGSRFAGWQRQRGQESIQALLEEALQVLTSAPVTLHGAGRTDAGVHAEGMTASFRTGSGIPLHGLVQGANCMLPPEIRVLAAENVANDFHARYNAKGKVYEYSFVVAAVMPPLLRLYAAHLRPPVDLAAMRACLPFLPGTRDFRSFEGAGSRDPAQAEGRGSVRTIFAASLEEGVDGCHRFTISGDGFLRHMVRNIAGTLFLAGRGKLSPAGFAALIAARDRTQAGPTAPACGLRLKSVFYE